MTKTFTKGMIILLLAVLGLSTGCAALVRTKRLDMGPFGENTTTMVNDIQLGLLSKKPLYIKPYLQGPDVVEFQKRWLDLQKVLRGIVMYSTQVVSLSRSRLKGPERAAMLAQYVEALTAPLVEDKNADVPLTRARSGCRAYVHSYKRDAARRAGGGPADGRCRAELLSHVLREAP